MKEEDIPNHIKDLILKELRPFEGLRTNLTLKEQVNNIIKSVFKQLEGEIDFSAITNGKEVILTPKNFYTFLIFNNLYKEAIMVNITKQEKIDTKYGTFLWEDGKGYLKPIKPLEQVIFTLNIEELK